MKKTEYSLWTDEGGWWEEAIIIILHNIVCVFAFEIKSFESLQTV